LYAVRYNIIVLGIRALHVSILCFGSYGAHRHHNSFPTRRSSDLRSWAWWLAASPRGRTWTSRPTTSACSTGPWRTSALRPAASRSEEHTSELQSREKLVCRLLLEKKKKTRPTITPVIRIRSTD